METNKKQTEQLTQDAVINWFLSLQFIFRPNWWSMSYPYSKEVDGIILELLAKHDFTNYCRTTKATAYLGNAEIWIENRPYASIRLYDTCLEKYRPSRLTILKALKKLKKLEQKEKIKQKNNFNECVNSVRSKLGLN